jgi:hypothetical protein
MGKLWMAMGLTLAITAPAIGQETRDADRGRGVASSMFGTYIERGQFLVYPFFEYYRDHDFEYKPEELGFAGELDFRGRYRAHEGLLFLGYGLTDDLAIEFEVASIRATLDKSPDDVSSMPLRLEESGLGDIEGQIRWRWRREDDRRPEFFSYGEVVIPHAEDKPLTGTTGWELKFGTGLVRGTRWGTWTVRGAIEYATGSTSQFDLGEYAVEYLKRLSPAWRIYAGIEGTQDEISMITEVQWHVTRFAFIRANSGIGLTSKATDWAPEVGVVFTIPTR